MWRIENNRLGIFVDGKTLAEAVQNARKAITDDNAFFQSISDGRLTERAQKVKRELEEELARLEE